MKKQTKEWCLKAGVVEVFVNYQASGIEASWRQSVFQNYLGEVWMVFATENCTF